MATDDELEINPFYKALQDKYVSVFEKAQRHCFWICVPISDSIHPSRIDHTFAETHVLRPSALFKGHFENICASKVKRLRLSDSGKYFTVENSDGKGKDEERIKIITEELAYNGDFKPYKILVIEKPLHPYYEALPKEKDKTTNYLHTPKLSIKECSEFLQSFTHSKQNLDKLNGSIEYFSRHYMVLEDYLDDAANRIGEICAQALRNVMKTLKAPLNQDTKFQEILAGAVEGYVMNSVYPKIYPVIRQWTSHDTKLLLSKCEKLNKVTPEQIGVPKEFACPVPSAVVELANLGSLQTPREKLICLKSTVDNTTQEVSTFVRESHLVGIILDNQRCITSDDLIPLLVMVIAQARCSHLPSDLFYIENFMWEAADRDRDNLSYCLVSFKAAVQYMISTDFSHLKEMKSSHEKEISIEELMRSKNRVESNPVRDSRPFPFSTSSPRTGRLERQLNRISGLLEKASLEASVQEIDENKIKSIFPDHVLKDPTPDLIPHHERGERRNSNSLGDFLTSLQKDAFDQPYGKQT